jgi:hypothetical protein
MIEREEAGSYQEALREFTTELYIEVSLLPGRYRYYVIPFDYLNQPGERSNLMYIEVLEALYPELDYFPSEFVYSNNDTVYEMDFTGRNLVFGAEIYLCDSEGNRIDPFAQQHINESGIRLSFNKDHLLPGVYELFVKNPGGLETSRSGIQVVVLEPTAPVRPKLAVEWSDKFNVFLSVAWMPLFSVYDVGNHFPDKLLSPFGAAVRFGVVSVNRGIVSFGAEFMASWCAFDAGSGESTAHFWATGINLLMQKWSPREKVAVTFRIGVGSSFFLFGDDEISFFDSNPFHANMGISLLGLIGKSMYLEAGIDFAHWFTTPVAGSFRPWLGLGLRF